MSTARRASRQAGIALLLGVAMAACAAEERSASPNLGEPVDPQTLLALDRTVFPDGAGLPEGSGDVSAGETLFAQRCAHCHGAAGEGGSAPELAYAQMPLDSEWPDQTIGSYWPYATTVFDFLRRAMPMEAPGSLTDEETYHLTAYLLHLNGLHERGTPLTREAVIALRMPNRDGFRWVDVQKPPPEVDRATAPAGD
ncbi:MAG: cytochrome c [Pseudomonadota bacterium]